MSTITSNNNNNKASLEGTESCFAGMLEIHFYPWKVPKGDTLLYKIKINKTKQKTGFCKKKNPKVSLESNRIVARKKFILMPKRH